MYDWRGQLDVGHALTAYLRAGDFNATTLADNALEANALVLAAVALPVLGRTEDLLAEQAVFLWLQCAVVNGLWFLDLAVGPHTDRVRSSQTNSNLIKVVYIKHACLSSLVASKACSTLSFAAGIFFI